MGLSTGTLFIDLRAAFHHMLREMIFNINNPLTRQRLEQFLNPCDFALHQLVADLDAECQRVPELYRLV